MDPSGKFATLQSTSKHFSDITAHRYIQLNCQDPGLKYIGGMKVFRDLIWLMQGIMKADHKLYKAHSQYEYAGTLQKDAGRRSIKKGAGHFDRLRFLIKM